MLPLHRNELRKNPLAAAQHQATHGIHEHCSADPCVPNIPSRHSRLYEW